MTNMRDGAQVQQQAGVGAPHAAQEALGGPQVGAAPHGGPDAAETATAPSFLDQLRERREALRAERTIDLVIPGNGDRLVGRFAPLSARELAALQKRMPSQRALQAGDESAILSTAEIVAAACRELFYREDDGTLIPLAQGDAPPVRFDETLTTGLGLGALHGSEAVIAVMDARSEPLRLLTLQSKLWDWMTEGDVEALERLSGE